ncbi:MAG: hypothetical protein HKL95_07595, partial [Phycisphaerae bacterium]|nr:hypothetical protein [Phycisphaerae bacterium]
MKWKVHRGVAELGTALLVTAASSLVQAQGPMHASVAVSPLFGNQMVLQRNAVDPVWGTAAPGEPVTVSIAGQRVKNVANAQGDWMVKLAPMKATFKPLTLKIR